MGSPLPLCAACGKPLDPGAHCTLRWLELPGEPLVGWHCADACLNSDELFDKLAASKKDTLTPKLQRELVRQVLEQVNARGEGRVLAGRAWWVHLEVA